MSQTRRFEVKIPIPLNRLQAVEHWLRCHPLMFATHYPARHVNSLYLDTPHLALYEENLSGISQRKKVRIRWYHDLSQGEKSTLEFKHRQAGKGFKISFKTTLPIVKDDFTWPKALKECFEALPTQGQMLWGNEQTPVLICRYLRTYYLSGCGRIRATFDSNMEVYDQRYRAAPNLSNPVSLGDYVLLELKADDEHEAILSDLISTCPLRPSRHSKYVNGIRNLTWI
ncbi:hypothetical protein PALB_13440 [Pseudoalteromonas luteoviolacea B = ATCC 29581]|nr:hypothetical protein PALB_13440 [Pseudoalteromonas luteoviolacea B = ATCC 29581]